MKSRLPGIIEKKPLTPRRAAMIISAYTFVITFAGGALAWALDPRDFRNFGDSLWWALQTVTTVGYGDVVPSGSGRVVGVLLMLTGIAFLTVITAAVTASLIEAARKRMVRADDPEAQLKEIIARLATIEARLGGDPTRGD
jgi:voltage-gated potassium channel